MTPALESLCNRLALSQFDRDFIAAAIRRRDPTHAALLVAQARFTEAQRGELIAALREACNVSLVSRMPPLERMAMISAHLQMLRDDPALSKHEAEQIADLLRHATDVLNPIVLNHTDAA